MLRKAERGFATKESLDSRLKAIVDRAGEESGASYAFVLLSNPETSELCNTAWYGREQAPEGCAAVARWVLSRAKPLFLRGQADAERIVGYGLAEEALPLICAPVMCNASPEGVLGAGSPYSAREEFQSWLPFFESLGELTATLLENSALQRELSRKEEQLRSLMRDTVDAQEAERERICLEVHDGVSQTLASAFQYLQTLEATSPEGTPARQLLVRASALVKQAIQESREVINSLQPATLRDLGLVTTLHEEMRQLKLETGWEMDFKADLVRLPHDVETGLYRIIHEAVANVRKHADSKRLGVRVTSADEGVIVEVRDWGVGFSYKSLEISKRRATGLLRVRVSRHSHRWLAAPPLARFYVLFPL